MSDCSTQAMTAKERTCGTCGNGLRVVDYSGKRSSCICEYNTRTRCTDVALLHGLDDECQFHPNSGAYRPRVEPDLEQRCQQLEQVAMELFDEYRRLLVRHSSVAGRISVMRDFKGAGGFREQLEALGVSVGD